jgi:hypothetical protein
VFWEKATGAHPTSERRQPVLPSDHLRSSLRSTRQQVKLQAKRFFVPTPGRAEDGSISLKCTTRASPPQIDHIATPHFQRLTVTLLCHGGTEEYKCHSPENWHQPLVFQSKKAGEIAPAFAVYAL